MKTGRCESFDEAARTLAERRVAAARALRLAGDRARRHGHAPVEPLAGAADHRHAALPAQRRAPPLRRLAQQHVRPPCPRRNAGAPIARSRSATRCAAISPTCSRSPRRRPFVEDCFTHLHSARSQIFTKMFPRCGVPDAYADWAEYETFLRYLYATGSVTEHTQLWWSVRLHLAYPTVEIRICDGQPELAEAISLSALIYALVARIARAVDEGEPLRSAAAPPHRGELLAGDPLRPRRVTCSISSGRPSGRKRPARAALEELVAWVLPVAEELGSLRTSRCPPRMRPSARSPAWRRAPRSRRSTPSRSREPAT